MGQLKQFWRQHPIQSVLYGTTALYIAFETFRAMKSPEGEFWNHKYGLYGFGSGPFARHQRMSQMPNPGQTAGTTSTSTTTSSSHSTGMMRGEDNDVGEPSMPMPMRLHGIPSSVKRRVNQGEYGNDSLPSEYGISGVFERHSRMNVTNGLGDTYMSNMTPEPFEGAAYY